MALDKSGSPIKPKQQFQQPQQQTKQEDGFPGFMPLGATFSGDYLHGPFLRGPSWADNRPQTPCMGNATGMTPPQSPPSTLNKQQFFGADGKKQQSSSGAALASARPTAAGAPRFIRNNAFADRPEGDDGRDTATGQFDFLNGPPMPRSLKRQSKGLQHGAASRAAGGGGGGGGAWAAAGQVDSRLPPPGTTAADAVVQVQVQFVQAPPPLPPTAAAFIAPDDTAQLEADMLRHRLYPRLLDTMYACRRIGTPPEKASTPDLFVVLVIFDITCCA